MKYSKMSKKQLLVAETFSYSYANYADHLGINQRFDEYMPSDVRIMEQAFTSGKGAKEIANKLKIDIEDAQKLLESFMLAKIIVYAKDSAESFKRAVRASVIYAIEDGLNSEGAVDKLVGQICYRAADFAYLLDLEGKELSDYSESLREE